MTRLLRGSLPAILVLIAIFASAPAAASSIHGIVETPGGGLGGARVELWSVATTYRSGLEMLEGAPEPEAVAVASSAPDGVFRLTTPGPGIFRVKVVAQGFVAMEYRAVAVVEPRYLPPVVLVPAAETRLRVVGAEGQPVSGARVSSSADPEFWRQSSSVGWHPSARGAWTDGDGWVALPLATEEPLDLRVLAEGVLIEPRTVTSAGDVVTRSSSSRPWVAVRDAKGRVTSNVLVRLGIEGWPLGRTDSQGRLQLPATWEGSLDVVLETADGRRLASRLGETSESDELLELPEVAGVAGRVLRRRDRRPLAGAMVWTLHDPGRSTFTDAEGNYRLPAGGDGPTWLQVETPGYLPRSVLVEREHRAVGRVPTVVLEPGRTVRGQVVDGSGVPVAGVSVEAYAKSRGQRTFVGSDPAEARSLTDSNGRFSLTRLGDGAGYQLRALRRGHLATAVELLPSAMAPGSPPLELVLGATRRAFGKVLDPDERPILGADVVVRVSDPRRRATDATAAGAPRGEGDPGARATTGDTGRFELASLPARQIDLEVSAEGFEPLTVRQIEIPSGGEPVDLGTVVLVPGSRLSGRVVDTEGEGFADTAIYVVRGVGRPERLVPWLEEKLLDEPANATTDGEGRFEITDLAQGERVHLVAQHPEFATSWQNRVQVPAAEPLTLVLEPGLRLVGRVVDAEGTGIAGAGLEMAQQDLLSGTDYPSGPQHRRSARSDAEGRFEFHSLRPGRITLTVSAHGYVPPEPVTLEESGDGDPQPIELVMEPGQSIEGRVADTEGEPIAGARLLAGPSFATSDGEGFYRLTGVPSGPLKVEARHIHYGRRSLELEVEPGLNLLDLTFETGHPVRGKVVDTEGRGVADVLVELVHGGRDHRRVQARSIADGDFLLQPVVDGVYQLRAIRQGYASGVGDTVRVAGQGLEGVEVVLSQGIEIRGQVEGLEIEELAELRLRAVGAGGRTVRGSVDYQGRFEVVDLAPGIWQLEASLAHGRRETRARLVLEPGRLEVRQNLVFEQQLTLAGQVLFEGRPLEGTEVSVEGLHRSVERSVHTDYRGGFEIEDLASGSYRLSLSNARQHLTHDAVVDLEGDRELTFDLEASRVRGEVREADTGAPIADAQVYLRRIAEGGEGSLISIGTDAGGVFALPRVPAGHYRLTARKDGFSPDSQELAVSSGVDVDGLEIALSATAGLELRILADGGPQPPWIQVGLYDDAGRALLSESRPLDGEGQVHLPTAPPGVWNLRVVAPGKVAEQRTVTVPSEPVDLVLGEAGRLRVRVPELYVSEQIAELELTDGGSRPFVGYGTDGALRQRWQLTGGAAVVEGLPVGVWAVRVVAPDGRVWAGSARVEGGGLADVALGR